MEYELVRIPNPINKDFSEMSIVEVDDYLKWFLSIKDTRLNYLCRRVFNSEEKDFSIPKLQALQYFLKENLAVRSRSKEEIEAEQKTLPKYIQETQTIPEYSFIEPTYSICFDIGIYFAEYLRSDVEGIEWTSEKEKEMAQYGRPILVKKACNANFCPSWIMGTVVKQVYENKIKEEGLVELFTTWKNNYKGIQKDFRALIDSWGKKKKK